VCESQKRESQNVNVPAGKNEPQILRRAQALLRMTIRKNGMTTELAAGR
jgi:hypothetical protein